jgi:hypothetical protein
MIKPILLILILCSFTGKKNLVEYRKLKWSDFKKVSHLNDASAVCQTGINFSYEISNSEATFNCKAVFYPSESYVVKGKETDWILNHEQRHFDITRYWASVLQKRLELLDNPTENSIQHEFSIVNSEWERMQDAYDLETSHSVDSSNQIYWDRKIEALLLTVTKP